MISSRYRNDGRSVLRLNEVQTRLRNQVTKKIDDNVYRLEPCHCAACGESEGEELSQKDRYGLALSVVICRECGLIYTNPRMDQASYTAFYDEEYRSLYHGKEFTAEDLYTKGLERAAEVKRFFAENHLSLEGRRVVEVGCGAGGLLAYFRDELNCTVAGCDFGSEGIQYGIERSQLDLQIGDLSELRIEWKPDLVIYSHVFEHVLDIKSECRNVKKLIAEGGILYIEIPSVKQIRQRYRWDLLRLLQNAHTYHFSLDSLVNVMRANEFKLIAGEEFARAVFEVADSPEALQSDYRAVMRHLRSTERWRWIGEGLRLLKGAVRRLTA